MALQIVQISDTHISLDFPQRANDLKNCIRAINELEVQPDLVIHTGDIANRGSNQEYHIAQQLLNQLNAPYFVIPGNRDRRAGLLSEFNDKRYQLSAQGWIQYSIEQYPVRLLMIDTLNEQSKKGQLCAERLEHLEIMLLADTTKPAALFLHHPPFEAVEIPDPFQYDNWNDVDRLSALLSRFTNICGVFCGHAHRFIDGAIAGVQASAISCSAGDLRWDEVSNADRKLPVFKVLTLPG